MPETKFSSANPITSDMVYQACRQSKYGLCAGAYGVSHDVQSLGYDEICAIAHVIRDEKDKSDVAVYKAQVEVINSLYSRGFQHGWDGKYKDDDEREEYLIGYEHGKKCYQRFANRMKFVSNFCVDAVVR